MAIRARCTKRLGTVYDVIYYDRGKQRWKRGFRTQRDARTFAAAARLGHAPGTTRLKTMEYLMQWHRDMIEGRKALETERTYAAAIRSITQYVGDIPLRRLTHQDIQHYLRAVPVKPTSAHLYGVVLRSALRQAVRWEYLSKNPMDVVAIPRQERPEHRVLDEEQMRLFLAASRRSPYYAMYCVALGAGLGMGECLGLEGRDVDLTFGRVTVRKGKSQKRRRTIKLPDFVREVLPRVADDERVFPHDPDAVRKDLRTYANLRFHELRHSHATALLLAGEPLKVVSERLGHSSVKITADVYQHVLPGMDERAAARLDEMLGKSAAPKC